MKPSLCLGLLVCAAGPLMSGPRAAAQTRGQFESARQKMVDESVVGAGVTDQRVIRAMLETPRHEFVASHLRGQAYYDMALPIGNQQTISSPFIVAYMTQNLDPRPTDQVLEVGTGSGYQAAVLSPLVKQVFSIEIVESLGRKATRTLQRLGYNNVFTKIGDGFQGWPEHAPFDKIVVTCSPEQPPLPLVEQLREGGLMVIPVGQRYQQTLYVFRKKNGKLVAEALRPTLFVPMTGQAQRLRTLRPDPASPQVVNGTFEEDVPENGFVPGWYYQRQLRWIEDAGAPQGQHFISFTNQDPGRAAHLLQGFPIDGRLVGNLELAAWVKYVNAHARRNESFPAVAITFYDENRKDLGHHWLGPFLGTAAWTRKSTRLRVPLQAREGILRVGLFGATGEIAFDDVAIRPLPR